MLKPFLHHLRSNPTEALWQVVASTDGKESFIKFSEDDLCCNVIVGADGENSAIAKEFDFERKILQGTVL